MLWRISYFYPQQVWSVKYRRRCTLSVAILGSVTVNHAQVSEKKDWLLALGKWWLDSRPRRISYGPRQECRYISLLTTSFWVWKLLKTSHLIFEFGLFPSIFVLLKPTYLVTLFDRITISLKRREMSMNHDEMNWVLWLPTPNNWFIGENGLLQMGGSRLHT